MRFCHPTFAWIALLAFLGSTVRAAVHAGDIPPLRVDRLSLNDGRTLTDVLIHSYDATTNRFFILVDNTATVLSANLLPRSDREQIKSAVKRTDSAPEREAVARPTTLAPKVDLGRSEEVVTPQPLEPAPPTNAAAAHREVALAHAERYYRFEYRAGSNQVSVTALDFDLADPEPIQGWPGRYRTTGRAFLEFFDSRGNSFQRATSAFEVITEQKAGEPLTVQRFERRS